MKSKKTELPDDVMRLIRHPAVFFILFALADATSTAMPSCRNHKLSDGGFRMGPALVHDHQRSA